MNIRPYSTVLRADGFTKAYDDRSGGGRTVVFQKTVGPREIEVQLWDDGKHRASHFLGGRMSTKPTHFSDVPGMKRAIKRELTRVDHPPRRGVA